MLTSRPCRAFASLEVPVVVLVGLEAAEAEVLRVELLGFEVLEVEALALELLADALLGDPKIPP
jgi:hypothetical protein